MEGDECTSPIGSRELTSVIKQEVVGRPMAGKGRDGCALTGTQPNRFAAVATVFRGKDQLVLGEIKITIRPAVIGAALELHQLLRRLLGALLGRVEVRPVFPQLVAAVLGGKYPARGVECDPFPVAQPGGEALGGREALPAPIGGIAPDAGARLKLPARLNPGRVWHSVFDLAVIGRLALVDVEITLRIDAEHVHRLIAGQMQSGVEYICRRAR